MVHFRSVEALHVSVTELVLMSNRNDSSLFPESSSVFYTQRGYSSCQNQKN